MEGGFIGGGDSADLFFDGTGNDQIRGFGGADLINLSADGESDYIGGFFFLETFGDAITGFDTGAPGEIPPPDPILPLPPILGGDVLVFDSLGFPGSPPADVASAVSGGFLAFADSGKGGTNILLDLDGEGDNLQVAVTLTDVAFSPAIQATLEDNIVFQPIFVPTA